MYIVDLNLLLMIILCFKKIEISRFKIEISRFQIQDRIEVTLSLENQSSQKIGNLENRNRNLENRNIQNTS